MNLGKELMISIELSKKAGAEILEVYNNEIEVHYKADSSPLTLADKRSNDVIVAGLRKEFPNHAILSEEDKADESRLNEDWCWVVDPLDGTKEFIKRNGEFTVNIALIHKNRTVLGVIYVPVTGELYYASRGNGAVYENNSDVQAIRVSEATSDIKLVCSRSHYSDKLKKLIKDNKDKIANIKKAGSSLKGCLVAKGEAEVYYRFGPTMEWDTAAMQCIVEEAGGIFRQIDGSEMLYNRVNNLNDKGFYIINKKENLFL
ncbi:3'(2'),5'-bisphosphate nucleotidase CysQ [Oceanirhabdus seepicola]|uniref:3'(2'),5'-bisphosphate nucleotidase CysQ n=1 Tax=Oceanirhabdus seepicola TaxID=2828781 RepID=A0A9J6NZD8_9CLOT|nr:3'(2'),5'-bisphosphate nucleotidase CysQ [Oceanirhabdus seepicola]MCM1989265.1 3'(2'),5'-bisphosphate nucleotidase CysQ [Oceanirhabdus seepicola]